MNKKFEAYFKSCGMEINGNNAYGSMNGYEVNGWIRMLDNKTPFMLHISFYANDDTKRVILNEIRDLKIKYLNITSDIYGMSLGLNDITVGKLIQRLPEIMNQIFEVLNKNEVLGIGYCPVCGNELGVEGQKYKVSGIWITLDQNCVQNLNAQINMENQDYNDAPNNYARGVIGALIGAFVGVVSYIVIFLLGFISALSAFISIALGTFLYKKLGGKPNKMMIVIVSTISVVAMLLTVFVLYYIVAIALAPDYGFSSTGLKAFTDMMSINDFSGEFIANLVMTALFSVLGVVGQIVYLVKSIQRQQEIK